MLKAKAIIACIGIAAAVSAQDGTTMGIVGVTRVSIPPAGGFNLVGFSFSSSTPLYLEDVFGTSQLTQGILPTLADRVYLWNGAQYEIYFQKADGLFYDGKNPFSDPKTTEVLPGTALFLQSPQSATETNFIFFSGDVLVTDSEFQSYSNLVMIANPYPTDLDLNSTNLDWSAASSGTLPTLADRIYIWNPQKSPTPGYDIYFLKPDGIWYEALMPFPLGDAVIPAGGGAFYQARQAFTNEVVRPFSAL